jgi:probable F420-dependent oxidoreductase
VSDVRVGVVLPTREAAIAGDPSARRLLDLAERAETAGFDSLWAGDAPFARPRFEPLSLLAGVAARTSRVTVGTAIILPVLRHPLLFAHAVATVDRIAEGRFVLGVGAGWMQSEFDAVGARFDQRVGRLLETLDICRTIWRASSLDDDKPVSFEGRYWSFSDIRLFPPPHRPEGPPVWMGGNADATIRRAATRSDGWFPTPPSKEWFAERWEKAREAAREAGRDGGAVDSAVYVSLNVDPDRRKAQEDTERYVLEYYGIPLEAMRHGQSYFVGDAEEAVEWLRGFVDAGARNLVLRFATLDPLPQLETVAEHVLPGLRAPG